MTGLGGLCAGALEALSREAAIVTRLRHPHIVQIHSVIDTDDAAYFIMELMRGGELFDKIVELGSYTERDAATCVRNVTDALAYLHRHGIVHRDLKPENLLLRTPDSITDVCIADFGYARLLGGMARANSVVGTADYVAPEVLLQCGGYTDRCDEWSLGVITYCLLCGYPPFHDETEMQTMENVRAGWFEFPQEEWDVISPAATNFIRQLLRVDPMLRMSADEALEHEWLTRMVNVPAVRLHSLHVGDELSHSQSVRRGSVAVEFGESPMRHQLSPRNGVSRRISRVGSPRTTMRSPIEQSPPARFADFALSRKHSMTSSGFLAAMEAAAERQRVQKPMTMDSARSSADHSGSSPPVNVPLPGNGSLPVSGSLPSSGPLPSHDVLSLANTPLRDSYVMFLNDSVASSPQQPLRRSSSGYGFLPLTSHSPPTASGALALRSSGSSDDGGGFLPIATSDSTPSPPMTSAPSSATTSMTSLPISQRQSKLRDVLVSSENSASNEVPIEPVRVPTPSAELTDDDDFSEFSDAVEDGARTSRRKPRPRRQRVVRTRRGSSVERVAPLGKRESLRRVSSQYLQR
jgi:calcium/calmodulin-dependent protein kinase I